MTTLETLDQVPSWSAVTERLIREDQKKLDHNDGDKAYVSGKFKRFSPGRCYECGEVGHIKRNCKIFKAKMGNVSYAKTEEEEEIVLNAGCVKKVVQSVKNGFLLDSAATQHMGNGPDKFVSIENSNENKVLAGDGKSLNISGKGDILLNLDSGKGNVTKCRLKMFYMSPSCLTTFSLFPKYLKR